MLEIFFSWTRTYGSSSTTSIACRSVTKYGLRYPRSNCMPSTTSKVVSSDLPSSTVSTPSLPTACIASEMMRPISVSPLLATVPTWAMLLGSRASTLMDLSWATMSSTARSMPRFISIGETPATTAFRPSL